MLQDQNPKRPLVDLDALPDSKLLDKIDTAEALGVSTGTLSVWRSTGRHKLPFVKVGRKVFYRVGDLRAWLDKRTHTVVEGWK
ncbi:helix-turn-helix domain-containing protein [Candidatus Methylocalor cossyra]|uniref:Helix-turn-helix domain-containing protein n=1 Tax=Candidatus Methylocalor cossyra TaxID=3108543 RepID=A0ABP1CCH3_9GAMM